VLVSGLPLRPARATGHALDARRDVGGYHPPSGEVSDAVRVGLFSVKDISHHNAPGLHGYNAHPHSA
jgi:hypothetical protein